MTDDDAAAGEIRLLVVDDHPFVREGLRRYLDGRRGLRVVAEAGDGPEALDAARRLRPDVVLLDLHLPTLGGVTVIERLREEVPSARVLVLTSFVSADEVLPAVQAGAAGYLLKDVEPPDLDAAIRAVHAGTTSWHPDALARIRAGLPSGTARRLADRDRATTAEVDAPQDPLLARLTPRERDVLGLLADGRSNAQIAERLMIGEATVKTHVSNLLAKLGVPDRLAAALYALRSGLGS